MKKIFYFKLFTFVFCFLFFICGAFAQNPNQNVISRIVIEPLENNSYTLSLLFDDEYKGNAFMQKSNAGEYYIFLPNTIYNKSVKTTYTIPSDRNKIKIYPEIKPYINKYNTNSKYVRLNVNMDNDYSIKLVSGLSKEYHQPFIISRYINFSSIFWFLMLILAGYVMYRILKNYKESQNFNCYTSYPVDFKFNTEPKRTQTDSSSYKSSNFT